MLNSAFTQACTIASLLVAILTFIYHRPAPPAGQPRKEPWTVYALCGLTALIGGALTFLDPSGSQKASSPAPSEMRSSSQAFASAASFDMPPAPATPASREEGSGTNAPLLGNKEMAAGPTAPIQTPVNTSSINRPPYQPVTCSELRSKHGVAEATCTFHGGTELRIQPREDVVSNIDERRSMLILLDDAECPALSLYATKSPPVDCKVPGSATTPHTVELVITPDYTGVLPVGVFVR